MAPYERVWWRAIEVMNQRVERTKIEYLVLDDEQSCGQPRGRRSNCDFSIVQ